MECCCQEQMRSNLFWISMGVKGLANRALADRYEQMSKSVYWETMYATAATAASNREQLFVALSEEHKQLAAHHGVEVDQAEDSLAHFGLIGANREIQDHEFDYDLMGS